VPLHTQESVSPLLSLLSSRGSLPVVFHGEAEAALELRQQLRGTHRRRERVPPPSAAEASLSASLSLSSPSSSLSPERPAFCCRGSGAATQEAVPDIPRYHCARQRGQREVKMNGVAFSLLCAPPRPQNNDSKEHGFAKNRPRTYGDGQRRQSVVVDPRAARARVRRDRRPRYQCVRLRGQRSVSRAALSRALFCARHCVPTQNSCNHPYADVAIIVS